MANNLFSLFGDGGGTKDSNAEPGDDDANSFFTEFDDFLNKEIGESDSPSPKGNNIQSSSYNNQSQRANTTNFSLTSIDDDPISHTPTQNTYPSNTSFTNGRNSTNGGNIESQSRKPSATLSQHLAQNPTASNPNTAQVMFI